MTTTVDGSGEVAVVAEAMFSEAERLALAGFLAGYTGLTRDACTLDLRQYMSWCQSHGLRLFQARRAEIECFGRDLEARGRSRATVARRLGTVAGMYRYAVEEDLLDHSPATHVRRPRLDYESHAVGPPASPEPPDNMHHARIGAGRRFTPRSAPIRVPSRRSGPLDAEIDGQRERADQTVCVRSVGQFDNQIDALNGVS